MQNAKCGTIKTENDDWNLFHISTWAEQSMHAYLTSKNDIEAYGMSHDMYIYAPFFLNFFYAQVGPQNASCSYEPFGVLFTETCKKTKIWPVILIVYSLQSRSRQKHILSHRALGLGRRCICCVCFIPSFASIRLYHWPKAQLCKPVTNRRCWVQYKCKFCCEKSVNQLFNFCVITLGYMQLNQF